VSTPERGHQRGAGGVRAGLAIGRMPQSQAGGVRPGGQCEAGQRRGRAGDGNNGGGLGAGMSTWDGRQCQHRGQAGDGEDGTEPMARPAMGMMVVASGPDGGGRARARHGEQMRW
jgi:hypothetical protein